MGQGLGIVPPGNTRGAAADFRLLSSERGQTRMGGGERSRGEEKMVDSG